MRSFFRFLLILEAPQCLIEACGGLGFNARRASCKATA